MSEHYFDSHCHFDFDNFEPDRAEVWQRCNEAGINQLLIPGVAPDQWPLAAKIARDYEGLCYAVGLHPWWLKDVFGLDQLSSAQLDNMAEQLTNAAQEKGCVAIGECGLDLIRDADSQHAQERVLAMHLEVAQQLELPIVIHSVKAHNPLIRLLKDHPLERGGVIHAFSGSMEMGEAYWNLGFYLGVGGTITYERAQKTRSAVEQMPLEALLLETDAPDMPLCGHQGERNSPERLPEIARALAELRKQSVEKIAAQTTANSRKLFALE